MNWGEFKDEVIGRIQDPEADANVAGWFNDVSLKVATDPNARWRHLYKRFQVGTIAPKAVTATVTADSAVVTVAGAVPAASWVGQLFQVDDEGPYYEIDALVEGQPQQISLTSTYIGTSGAKAATIVFYQVSLPADWSTPWVSHVRIAGGAGSSPEPLTHVTDGAAFAYEPNEATPRGRPRVYRITGTKLQLAPPPDSAYQLTVNLGRRPKKIAADAARATDLDWPEDFHPVLLDGVLEIGLMFTEDSLHTTYGSRFAAGLAGAIARQNREPGGVKQMGRYDGSSEASDFYRGPRLPEEL